MRIFGGALHCPLKIWFGTVLQSAPRILAALCVISRPSMSCFASHIGSEYYFFIPRSDFSSVLSFKAAHSKLPPQHRVGISIATCCHHACHFPDYAGRDWYLAQVGTALCCACYRWVWYVWVSLLHAAERVKYV
jgi:hypothetical protein